MYNNDQLDALANNYANSKHKIASILDVIGQHPLEAAALGALAGGTILGGISYGKSKKKDVKDKAEDAVPSALAGTAMGAGLGTLAGGLAGMGAPSKPSSGSSSIGGSIGRAADILEAAGAGGLAGMGMDTYRFNANNSKMTAKIKDLDALINAANPVEVSKAQYDANGNEIAKAVMRDADDATKGIAERAQMRKHRIARMMETYAEAWNSGTRDYKGVSLKGMGQDVLQLLKQYHVPTNRTMINMNPKNLIMRAIDSARHGKLRNPLLASLAAGGIYGLGASMLDKVD